MTTLYLIRHAQAEGNLLSVFNGSTDGELTEIGYKQLDALSDKSKELAIDVIYSSPLKRAYQTAKAVNKSFNLHIIKDSRLIEINCGDWETKTWDFIMKEYKESYDDWVNTPHNFQSPNGESMLQAYNRVVSRIDEIVTENKGKTIAVVAHAAVIRCYLAHALGYTILRIGELGWGDNTNISKITFDEHLNPVVEYRYDNSHLPEEISTFAIRKKTTGNDVFNKKLTLLDENY